MSDRALQELVRTRWAEYARLRWAIGEKRERHAWQQFVAEAEQCRAQLEHAAWRRSAKIDFDAEHLELLILQALDRPCRYCTHPFGVESFAIVYKLAPHAGVVREREMYLLRNLAVCCQRCGDAKGMLSEAEWLDVLQALKGADERAVADVLGRLARTGGRRSGQLRKRVR